MNQPDAAETMPALEPVPRGQQLEFRLKVMQQFTTLSVAGAGLSLTLIGTVLSRTSIISWLPVAMFTCAVALCMIGQMRITALAESDLSKLPSTSGWVGLIGYFLGAGFASLCLSVLKAGGT